MKEYTSEQREKIDKLIKKSVRECELYSKEHPTPPNTLDGGQPPPYMIKFREEFKKIVNEE